MEFLTILAMVMIAYVYCTSRKVINNILKIPLSLQWSSSIVISFLIILLTSNYHTTIDIIKNFVGDSHKITILVFLFYFSVLPNIPFVSFKVLIQSCWNGRLYEGNILSYAFFIFLLLFVSALIKHSSIHSCIFILVSSAT